MNVIVFEDSAVVQLGVLTAARPACDLTIGATTLFESLCRCGVGLTDEPSDSLPGSVPPRCHVHRVLRPHLHRYLQSLAGRRMPLWGGNSFDSTHPNTKIVPAEFGQGLRHGNSVLIVNARVVPSRHNIVTMRSIVEAGRRGVMRCDGAVAVALLHRAPDTPSGDGRGLGSGSDCRSDGMLIDALLAGTIDDAVGEIESLGLDALDGAVDMVSQPHEVVAAHEQAIAGGLAIRLDTGRYREEQPGLFVAAGASVAQHVVVRHGPVVVEAGAEIGPFVCLDGPIWIARNARVNPHAWIRGGTAIGHDCRVGGEVEASVLEPFSNKSHDGFLGHSHLGSWVNLAAGTITSNLKATYGPVRLHQLLPDNTRTTVHTGRQFLGAMIGDCVKTGINTSIPCGARIGVASTVAGLVEEQVAAFTNQLIGVHTTAEQAAIVLERMMARRGLAFFDADRELFAALERMSAPAI